MPPRRQPPHVTGAPAALYRSVACCIGTYLVCAESSPASTPPGLPVIYEACGCSCHAEGKQSTPAEVAR